MFLKPQFCVEYGNRTCEHQSGHQSSYWLWPSVLNFSELTRTGVLTPPHKHGQFQSIENTNPLVLQIHRQYQSIELKASIRRQFLSIYNINQSIKGAVYHPFFFHSTWQGLERGYMLWRKGLTSVGRWCLHYFLRTTWFWSQGQGLEDWNTCWIRCQGSAKVCIWGCL